MRASRCCCPSTFPLAQQVAAGEILVGFGLNHSAQIPCGAARRSRWWSADPAPIARFTASFRPRRRTQAEARCWRVWLATPEGAKAYEDATDRGNPFIAGTKTNTLLKGHTISQFTVEQAAQEAAVVQRINKMIESRETQ